MCFPVCREWKQICICQNANSSPTSAHVLSRLQGMETIDPYYTLVREAVYKARIQTAQLLFTHRDSE